MTEGRSPDTSDNRVLNPTGPRIAATRALNTEIERETPTPGRRTVLGLIAAGLAALALKRFVGSSQQESGITGEQKTAKEKWELLEKQGNTTDFVSLKVGQDGASVRNEPKVTTHSSSFVQDPDTRNEVIGNLKPGVDLQKALIWEGLNPDRPGEKGTWYVIPLSDGKYGFSWSGNFNPR